MRILLSVVKEDMRQALRDAAAAEGLEVLEPLASVELEAAIREFSPELAVISSDMSDARHLAVRLRSFPGRAPAQILACAPAPVTEIGGVLADADDILELPMPHAFLRARLQRAAAAWTRRRDEDLARLQEKILSASRVRHNVNNLLFVVTGNIEWLQTRPDLNSPESRECLTEAFLSVQKLQDVLQGVQQEQAQSLRPQDRAS